MDGQMVSYIREQWGSRIYTQDTTKSDAKSRRYNNLDEERQDIFV
jgi:hypothetical protein